MSGHRGINNTEAYLASVDDWSEYVPTGGANGPPESNHGRART
jgi:hypothetical protein